TSDMYGGSYRLFSKIHEKMGIKFHLVDMGKADAILPLINEKTKLFWVETPTNPMMNIADISALSAIAKRHKLLLCVDNTFATPFLQNPIEMGADIVVHSATKYLGGHSDVIMGALMTNDKNLRDQLYFIQKSA